MIEPRAEDHRASDGYSFQVLVWPVPGTPRGRVVVLHGVQSHAGWYHRLGRSLAEAGYEAHFPDRRGSGANAEARGHAPSARRLIDDVSERIESIRKSEPGAPVTLAGISWGGKLAVVTAAVRPDLVNQLALICPGLLPRVGVSPVEKLRIAWAFLTRPRKAFPIPLNDPALFTASPEARQFIADDPLALREGTAGLLATSYFMDARARRAPAKVTQPVLLMLAGQDRIVDNAKTLAYFQSLASPSKSLIEYPEGHHTLEFDPDPEQYARDLIGWLNQARSANLNTGAVVDRDTDSRVGGPQEHRP